MENQSDLELKAEKLKLKTREKQLFENIKKLSEKKFCDDQKIIKSHIIYIIVASVILVFVFATISSHSSDGVQKLEMLLWVVCEGLIVTVIEHRKKETLEARDKSYNRDKDEINRDMQSVQEKLLILEKQSQKK